MTDCEITVSLPEELLRNAEAVVTRRQTSFTQMVVDALTDVYASDLAYEAAQKGQLALFKRGFDLGTGGRVTWTRDELHER